MEEKTITIPLANGGEIKLLWTRPTRTANWVCQSSNECLCDMQENLINKRKTI